MASTSKEALEILRKIKIYERESSCYDYLGKYIFEEEMETIRKDLERLEKLEQIIGIVKSIGLTFQKDLEYYDCDYGDWFKAPYAIEGSPVSEAEWKLVKEEFEGEE